MTDTLIADADGIYHPALADDRLVLGMKGTLSELLCRIRHNASLGYSFNRSGIGSCSWSSPVLHGRFARERSRLGGWPLTCGG